MNFPYFIARKVATSDTSTGQRSFSRLIIRISIVAVALSVAVMIVATALIRGFKNEISSKVFGFWGHIHITDSNIAGSLLDTYPIKRSPELFTALDTIQPIEYIDFVSPLGITELGEYKRIKRTQGGIAHVQQFAIKPGIIKTDETIEGIILKGVGEDFEWNFLEDYLLRGRRLALPDSSMSREILISQQTSERLKVDTSDAFIVHFVQNGNIIRRRFEVVGIYKTGLEEYDRRFALVDIRQIQRILGWDDNQISGLEIFVDNIDDLRPLTEYIYLYILPNNMYAETIREKFPAIFEWLELQDINEVVILALMIIVSIINMMTALMILILERTNMIGTLKALGSTNWTIRRIFLYHASYIILLGLFWGNVIGLALCCIQEQFEVIKLSEADYYLSVAPIEVNIWILLSLNAGTLAIILLFLIIPSYLVTRISPVKAIRFK